MRSSHSYPTPTNDIFTNAESARRKSQSLRAEYLSKLPSRNSAAFAIDHCIGQTYINKHVNEETTSRRLIMWEKPATPSLPNPIYRREALTAGCLHRRTGQPQTTESHQQPKAAAEGGWLSRRSRVLAPLLG